MMRYRDISDNELGHLLSQGDVNAYTEIYNRYKEALYLHAYRKLENAEEARDLVQELFATLWVSKDAIEFHTTLSGYLFGAVRNRVINVIVKRGVELKYSKSLGEFIERGVYSTDELLREKELALQINSEIERLPAKMREIFKLSRESHLSHRAIADKLDLSEQTVRTQIRNVLRILRMRVGPFHVLLLSLHSIFK